ncbi:MAG: 2-C-methyl-D-erythritol 4-phosphate cytidylyltransferase [Propionibacteriaceae bacterium]|nr:2-C-methyl-D-erythritol 4-phosphate cytidylyltransferase [Propionibacteriaceae bacterium]
MALVFAGGVGTRMDRGDDLPKQFIEVGGSPILVHTLRRFQECPDVDLVYLVVPTSWIDHTIKLVTGYRLSKVAAVVRGGDTALESVYNGLERIVADDLPENAIVLVHDGVRPIINNQLICANIDTTRQEGNAITCIPAFETIALRASTCDVVDSVVNRQSAVVLQAPQTFFLADVFETNLRAHQDGVMSGFVDQADMQSYYGKPLHLVEGFRGNVKITIPDDVRYFSYLIETGAYAQVITDQPDRARVL